MSPTQHKEEQAGSCRTERKTVKCLPWQGYITYGGGGGWWEQSKVFPHLLARMRACVITVSAHRQSYCITLTIQMPRENCSRHLSLLHLQRPLLPLHLATRFTSAFPAAFLFTRSAATVSLSFFSPLSTSILSKPLAGAFNRQWHLSPRAVMSPIHQRGMTGCMPPHPPTEAGRWGGFTLYQTMAVGKCVCCRSWHSWSLDLDS